MNSNAALPETRGRQVERGARDIQRDMLHASHFARRRPARIGPGFVGEDRQQPSIARVKVQVVLVRLSQVGLLENERHPERPFPEINRALPRRPDDGDVMQALHLNRLLHARSS